MVEFVLVAPVLLLVALAVIQIALVAQLRVTMTSAAAEGARAASLAGSSPQVGELRTRALLAEAVGIGTVDAVHAYAATIDGLPVMSVRVEATPALIGLLGPATVVVEGHALTEAHE